MSARTTSRVLIALSVALVGTILVGAYVASNNSSRISRDEQLIIAANRNAIGLAHKQALAACKAGNTKLRRVINQRIVRPLYDLTFHAGRAGGSVDPNFYRRVLGEVATVPYALCGHRYAPIGRPSRPPYFREAPLPKPLRLTSPPPKRSASPTGAAPAAPNAATVPTPGIPSVPGAGATTSSPPTTVPSSDGSGGASDGGQGGDSGGGNPPPSPPPPPTPKPPPPKPTCVVNALGIRICLPPVSL